MSFFESTLAVTAKEPLPDGTARYWMTYPSVRVADRYNNCVLVSIGWTVGVDLPKRSFVRMEKTRITYETWNR